jgi:hypothetical protein
LLKKRICQIRLDMMGQGFLALWQAMPIEQYDRFRRNRAIGHYS